MISKDYTEGDETLIHTAGYQWHMPYVPALAEVGEAVTIWHDDKPLVIIGVFPIWEGVAEGWVVLEIDSGVPLRQIVSLVKWWMDKYCIDTGIRRLESSCATREQFRWMRLVGFEFEYIKPEGSPDGADVIGMVKWYRRVH